VLAIAAASAGQGFAQDSAAQSSERASSNSGLEEILVTAQRRSESQQDVPISISTVTAAAALRSGVTGTEALGALVPSLQFSRQFGNGGAPFLRGVGTSQAVANTESPVAVYIDDVYIGASASTLMQFNNIQNIEVLKGPQGTLFGRNATGGVITIHTKRPSDDPAMDLTVGGGSYGTYYGNFYATGPLTENVSGSIAATGRNQSKGYGESVVDGDDIYKDWNVGARAQLLWTPSDATSVMLSGDYSKSEGDHGQNVVIAPGTVGSGGQTYQGPYVGSADPDDYAKVEAWGTSARIEHDLGPVSLVSISAVRHVLQNTRSDADGTLPGNPAILGNVNHAYIRTFSQELQMMSTDPGPFNWIVGGYYYKSTSGYDPAGFGGLAFAALGSYAPLYDEQRLHSFAGFGEAGYELPTRTKITFGLRYTNDDLELDAIQYTASGGIRPPYPISADDNFSKLTYRAIIDQKVGDNLMLFASYSRGFKSGGYNLPVPIVTVGGVPQAAPAVEPEVLDAYEIGLKSELFDRRLRLNVSAFHYDYTNMQVSSVQNGAPQLLNAAGAKMNGVDVDWQFVPTERISFSGGISYLDSKFSDFPVGPYYVPNPASCATLETTGPQTGGNTTCFTDLEDYRTPRAPKFSASFTAAYTQPTEIGDFQASATLYHNSGFFWEPDNQLEQPSYNLLSAAIDWTSPSDRIEIQVYGRNLLDEYYYSYGAESSTRMAWSPEMPRNFGASMTVHW